MLLKKVVFNCKNSDFEIKVLFNELVYDLIIFIIYDDVHFIKFR